MVKSLSKSPFPQILNVIDLGWKRIFNSVFEKLKNDEENQHPLSLLNPTVTFDQS